MRQHLGEKYHRRTPGLESCPDTHLESEHKRLYGADALRLSAVEIVSDRRVDIKSQMSAQHKLYSDAGICRKLSALYSFLVAY